MEGKKQKASMEEVFRAFYANRRKRNEYDYGDDSEDNDDDADCRLLSD